jgi:hypothetical protein
MKLATLLAIMLVLTWLVAPASAQTSHGYFFVAPGAASCSGCGNSMTLHFGGGGEGIFGKGIGIGAELGYLTPREDMSDGLGVFSPNGYFHFGGKNRSRKADPFVTAGYTLLFRGGHANLWNFGGGLNYWFGDRVGLKVELRDHVWSVNGTEHYWGVRIGITFR